MKLGGYRIAVIISVFQTEDAGSTPATRSRQNGLDRFGAGASGGESRSRRRSARRGRENFQQKIICDRLPLPAPSFAKATDGKPEF